MTALFGAGAISYQPLAISYLLAISYGGSRRGSRVGLCGTLAATVLFGLGDPLAAQDPLRGLSDATERAREAWD
ncbi:MAG: hypothetical protein ACRELV_12270, partial [Longimicrobiales bacterium]